jgi:hypothetical protein
LDDLELDEETKLKFHEALADDVKDEELAVLRAQLERCS